jgi:molecular chaperone GrpE
MMDKKEQVPVEENQVEESSAEVTGEEQSAPQAKEQVTAQEEGSPPEEVGKAEATIEEDEVDAESMAVEEAQEIIARLEAELAEAKVKADQYLDQMQRSAAEFQNARRRQERQLQDQIDRATEGLIRRLLPVLDDFDLAFSNVPDSLQGEEAAWVEGFQRIYHKLATLLSDEGVVAIDKHGPFDPSRHEAVTHEPNDEIESGHVIETLRTGYEYRDKVLRPALVRVAQ